MNKKIVSQAPEKKKKLKIEQSSKAHQEEAEKNIRAISKAALKFKEDPRCNREWVQNYSNRFLPSVLFNKNKTTFYINLPKFLSLITATYRNIMGGLEIEPHDGKNVQICFIGGGLAFESNPVRSIIPEAQITSLDIASSYKEESHTAPTPYIANTYITGDASKPSTYGHTTYDVLMFNHPQIVYVSVEDVKTGHYKINTSFKKVIQESYYHLKDQGLAVATCFTHNECIAMKNIFKELGYSILSDIQENPFQIPTPNGLFFSKTHPDVDSKDIPYWQHFTLVAKKEGHTPRPDKETDHAYMQLLSFASQHKELLLGILLSIFMINAINYLNKR